MTNASTSTNTRKPGSRKALNAEQRARLDGTDSQVKGWLVWWSILGNERNVDDLKRSAIDAGLDMKTIDRITGRSSKTAWQNATQLGARGKPSRAFAFDPQSSTARYLVRDLKPESRALIREVINGEGEKVDSYQVATIYHLNSGIEFALDTFAIANKAGEHAAKLEAEIKRTIGEMKAVMDVMVGSVDDSKIRNILLDWLRSVHRVCVRGTGGVYYIPRPSAAVGLPSAIEAELIAWRSFINGDPVNSTFSIVEITNQGATTIGDFAKSAIEEMREEIEEIEANLAKWAANGNMNDGSKMYSSQTMIEKAQQLIEKGNYLADSLGEELFVMVKLAEVAEKKARAMNQASTSVVEADRMAKVATKAPKAEGEKKSGTAAKRNEKKVID